MLVTRDALYDHCIRFMWREMLDEMQEELRKYLSPVSLFYLSQTCKKEAQKCGVSRHVKVHTLA